MSRLIIKNLPNKVTVESLKDIFGEKGEVTDVQLKYTKDGRFRNFGFVGYRTEEQAQAAKEYFDGTCIRSMKIDVQVCANLGDQNKPRAWSKYAPDSTAYKKMHPDEADIIKEKKVLKKQEKNKNKIIELLKKHKDDPLFAEFIDAHVNDKTAWLKEAFKNAAKSDDDDDDDSSVEEETKTTIEDAKSEVRDIKDSADITKKTEDKVANKQISDLEYMKILMKKVGDKTETTPETVEHTPKKVRNRPLFHVKITGLPFKCKKKDIKEFFRPLVPYSIRLPLGKGKRLAGFCYVGFRTEKELKKALSKDKLFIANHRVHIHKYEDQAKKAAEEEEQNNQKHREEKQNTEETIGESGSIFVRNLPYVVTEEEVTKLFEKYGPIADVNMPLDQVLRQPKGFATVTFVMPEHAVKAYTELDGTVFCGRMLHLLPAKTEKLEDSDDEGLSFKEKKAKKLKALAKSSHNWNTLFLGANAIADVVASNYNTTKEQLLTENSKNTSAAVRLALGETQLVAETRAFLESNGVYLDAFNKSHLLPIEPSYHSAGSTSSAMPNMLTYLISCLVENCLLLHYVIYRTNPAVRRSKTCILVKNLPAGTEKDEIKVLFEKHGHIARFLMPKRGITTLVDFVEPFEAKKAFSKLAYSQFKNSPLYLEWAPENVFLKSAQPAKLEETAESPVDENNADRKVVEKDIDSFRQPETKEDIKEAKEIEIEEEDLGEPENETTLFIKNLNFVTTEEDLKRHFSAAGKIHSVTIAKKKDPKKPGQMLSMGYGFIQFYKKQELNAALKLLQNSTLDGKQLELKRSERGNSNDVKTSKKSSKDINQNGTKILVRNVPFQANRNELHEIFRAFGEIKTLRLPKKLTPGSDQHRGFAFVDYHSKADAKSAFEALCQSTHLYGRRLVLEWADQTDDNEDINKLRKRTAEQFNAKTPGGKKSRKGAVDVENFVDGDK